MPNAYRLTGWHTGPGCDVTFVTGANGVGVWIACISCRCITNVDAAFESGNERIVETVQESYTPTEVTP